MRHIRVLERPICERESPVEEIRDAARLIYCDVDCSDCLERAIAETDERGRALRDLLSKVTSGGERP